MAKQRVPRLRILDPARRPQPLSEAQAGLLAFQRGDLAAAIAIWSSITAPDEHVLAALAEAHFRLAVGASSQVLGEKHLAAAAKLRPDDPRIEYVRGIYAHQAGDFKRAGTRYRATLRSDPTFAQAGLLLALATLAQDPQAAIETIPGSTPEIRAWLAPVQQLLRGDCPPEAPHDPAGTLWHGLGLIPTGSGAAAPALDDTRPLPSARAGAIRRYYRGVAAAQRGSGIRALAGVASQPALRRQRRQCGRVLSGTVALDQQPDPDLL